MLGAMIDLRNTPLPPVIRLADNRYSKLYRTISDILPEHPEKQKTQQKRAGH